MMSENTIKLSIIVPMYKVAPYVARCLRSLANQDIPFDEYEIICINDGSPDNSAEIVEGLKSEIPNIVLINQENQGVSMARNNGMAVARGKYMMPIDPDDYVVPHCFKAVAEQADNNNLDVLYCAFEIFDVNEKSIWRTDYSHLTNQINNGYEGYFATRGYKVVAPDRSWAILYRKNLIKKYEIKYPKNVPILEDGVFLGKVCAVAAKVGYSNDDFYIYINRENSAMNSGVAKDDKATQGFLNAIEDLKRFEEKLLTKDVLLLNHVKTKFMFLVIISKILKNDFVEFKKLTKILKTNNYDKISLDGIKYHYKRFLIYYKMSPFLFYILFKLESKINVIFKKIQL